MKTLIPALVLATLPPIAHADLNPALVDMQTGKVNPAPAELTLEAYQAWVAPYVKGSDAMSAFTPKIFEWYQVEKDRALPPEVYKDPQHIYVNVARPLQETDALEKGGDITEGNTVGAEVYAEQTGTLKQALDTMLFRWGKPTGAAEGKTYAPGGNFQKRVDYYAANPEWGPNAFASLSMRRNGGIIADLSDRYIVLVRGDETRGYDVLMQYVKPGGGTSTEKCFAIAMLRALPGGKVAYKISTRYQGQNYSILGSIAIGRAKVGFNPANARNLQIESNGMLKELQDTGTIKDRKSDIEFGH